MLGLFTGFLSVLAMIPFTIWFIVKAIRACFSKDVREDMVRRPIFHSVWGVGGGLCLAVVVSWLTKP